MYEKIDDMHDLSGNMVKVVQWAIITTVTGITENARVIVPSEIAAFSDDLTPEDFSTWAITLSARKIEEYKIKWEAELREQRSLYQLPVPPWDPKFLRVAYFVMNRFTVADIDYEELTAIETRNVAGTLNNVVRGLRSIAREIPMDNIEFSVKPPSKNTLSEDPKDNKPEAQDSSGEFPSNNE